MSKLPALQFYPGDWKKDPGIQALDRFSRSVWFDILLLMHESSERGVLLLNGFPYPDDALANALLLDNQILTTTLTKILAYGVASKRESDGAIYNRRMVRDEGIRQIRTIAGLQGGNPALLKQIPTPSSSSSSSSSDLINTNPLTPLKGERRKRQVKVKKYRELIEEDFTPHWPPSWKDGGRGAMRSWIDYKAKAGHPAILESYLRQMKQFTFEPKRFHELVERAISKGWQGLNEELQIGGTQSTPSRFKSNSEPTGRPQPAPFIPPEPQEEHDPETRDRIKALLGTITNKMRPIP